ncbi:protein phosphatase Slingshot-like [Carassius auratus]|uniref:Protein phosphatase Slingshot-like n=1 Tax=Carassius auratus TaxID=7957 RepID=A0A6P6J9M7_CARAU|nr:protein phosphatase Slingshot-like [Carassius auratus]
MITPDTVSIVAREVRLEVYLNGVFYTGDSCFALDGKDVQLELEITDAIYDLLGFSGNQEIDVKLQVMTDDHISVSSCSPGEMHVQLETDENEHMSVCEVKDLQLEMNRNSISELKSPEPVSEDESDPVPAGASGEQALDDEENRSTESTGGWMFEEMSAFFQTNTMNAVGEPEEDLIDPKESQCVPDPSVPEPELEMDLVSKEQLCMTEPKVDLVEPAVPEPEAQVTSDLSRLENHIPLSVFQLEDRLRECTLSKTPVSEVWPRVFIGNEETARDRDKLKEMGITHILNAAAPKKNLKFLLGMAREKDLLGTVNTGSRYYRGLQITYCGLPSSYRHCSDISEYFIPAAKFIDKALRNPMSKVLIHCTQGLSHSVTLFLAYLMICHDMMVEEAIDHVMKVRRIRPWFGHLRKLLFLNAELVLQRKLKLQGKEPERKRQKWQIKTK